jgi:hypothetical protein
MVRAELSFGRELIAAWTVLNCPVPAGFLTTTAPAGAVVREARFSKGDALPVSRAVRTPNSKKSGANMAIAELNRALGKTRLVVLSTVSSQGWRSG